MPFETSYLDTMLDAGETTAGPFFITLMSGGVDGTEVSGTGYARLQITFAGSSGGNKANSAQVQFDNAGETDWSSAVNAWNVFDAASGGNRVAYGTTTGTRDMSIANATLTFAVGEIDFDLT